MPQPSAEPTISGGTLHSAGPEMHLHGRPLMLARLSWITVTLILVLLNLLALPDTYLAYFHFTAQELQELHWLGLSPTLFGLLLVLENAPFQVVTLVLGLLLFWRRSNDRMALFCSFALVTFGSALPLYNFNTGVLAPSLATNALVRVLTLILFGMGEASFAILFYLFPSGRFAPRWTRWCALGVVIYWLAVVFFPTLPSNAGGLATYFIPLSLLGAVVAQVYRYRRVSTESERQQTKWAVFGFVLAILLLALSVPLGFLVPSSIQHDPVLGNLNPIFPLTLPLIPLFLAIAVLRSRLWDIDTLINKALVYGLLTGLLAALYVGLIIGLESLVRLFGEQTASNSLVLVASTLVIFVLFQPLRSRIQRMINHRFYRNKYDAIRTVEAFSATLRNEVDLKQLTEHLVVVIQETMRPASVSLWLVTPQKHVGATSSRLGAPNGFDPDRLESVMHV